MRESDLYPPVKAYLQAQGYTVKGEVGAADIVARRGDEAPLIVELKTGFSLALFHQAIARQAVSDLVYVAVPKPKRNAKENVRMARMLGLGVIFVRPRDGLVEVMADPGPFRPRKSRQKAARLLRDFERLRGDPNAGGATRHGLVTGYRQDALACARFLAVHGPSRGAIVADGAEVPQATRIMADNHYGWFERVTRGVYGLSAEGRQGLKDWGDA
ncbi:MAG: DUF2161 family putative PD-(D/E)XK-type phosphodiesterase [Salibaculum sp.]|uniref:DUF2161 domain-containing phosphodiesterase n=1 Tax=Roseovarius halophilus (ex Wu et al. 2025) TaxID=3376060 RepID=UPI0028703FC9|nr:DUF2161 family putative PD-(D/E)XK-type phosphodiesterase [Salibaculum sp.]MDR9427311.1 DUF2161 family putative PD-(D/E)XK-type phosphodiesterase [Salibaculum sp.]MDR9481757.1 DUF2161 family putative PD-(D/E)XK-type phosphodiesterase [Salibaculum sp.]